MANHEAERSRLLGVAWADVHELRTENDQLAAEVRKLRARDEAVKAVAQVWDSLDDDARGFLVMPGDLVTALDALARAYEDGGSGDG